jgi:hypothetical protein
MWSLLSIIVIAGFEDRCVGCNEPTHLLGWGKAVIHNKRGNRRGG